MNGHALKRLLKAKEFLLIIITLAIIVLFYCVNKNYLSTDSLRGIMQAMSITGIMSIGVAYLLIGGGIDLATSLECLFAGVLTAILIVKLGISWPVACLITLLVSAFIGWLNAVMITRLGMMPFISTIAVSSVLTGVNLALTNSQNTPIPVESFWWGGGTLAKIFPVPFVIMIVLLLIGGFILKKTQFGRNIYLVGGNQQAARLSGINPARVRTYLYIINAVMAGFSGIVLASRMHTASPSSLSDAQMDAITASVLGGIAFTGGAGGMLGCFIGILLLNFFSAGLNMLALESYWSTISSGVLLVIALTVDYLNERSRERLLKTKPAIAAKEASK
ncbi:MAG: ABC transporter permease [Oscillospiraceae bacterium]|jgi:ribose/xylose/arabinose/galactoside ABC-type transport system permease subunit|nr:ABC transporter permease [Oscillospiraceae bacterium]